MLSDVRTKAATAGVAVDDDIGSRISREEFVKVLTNEPLLFDCFRCPPPPCTGMCTLTRALAHAHAHTSSTWRGRHLHVHDQPTNQPINQSTNKPPHTDTADTDTHAH